MNAIVAEVSGPTLTVSGRKCTFDYFCKRFIKQLFLKQTCLCVSFKARITLCASALLLGTVFVSEVGIATATVSQTPQTTL